MSAAEAGAVGGVLAAWLVTYAVHSTLLVGGVWAAARWVRRPAVRDALWKTAMTGALLSATFQATLGVRPPLRVSLPTAAPVERAAPDDGRAGAPAAGSRSPLGTAETLAWLWVAGAALALARCEWSRRRFWRRLGPRRVAADPATVALLEGLRSRTPLRGPVWLSASARLRAPAVLGWGEICVPEALFGRLGPAQREGVLAHELAHVVRRDPLWRLGGELLAAVFFFQPLQRLAARRWQETAELVCDDAAVALTGRPRALVESLAELAATLCPERVAAAVALGDRPSALIRRVERLARAPEGAAPPAGWRARWLPAGALLALVAAAAPGAAPSAPVRRLVPQSQEVLFQGVRFDAARTAIVAVEADGYARVVERAGDVTRTLEVRAAPGGAPRYTYRENGAPRPFDAAGHRWLAGVLAGG